VNNGLLRMLSLAGTLAPLALAPIHVASARQDAPVPPPKAPQAAPDAPPAPDAPTPERLREFLAGRLERLRAEQNRLEEAVAMLDRGESPETVKQMLTPRRDGGGPEQGRFMPGERHGPGVGVAREGPGPRDQAPGGRPRILNDELRERVLNMIREKHPEAFRDLQRLREQDPQAFDRKIAEAAPRFLDAVKAQIEDPAAAESRKRMFEIGREVEETLRAIEGAEDAGAREDLVRRLRELINEQFELRIGFQQRRLEGLERQIGQVRREIEEFQAQRDQLVDQRLVELIERGPAPRDGRRHPEGPEVSDRPGPRGDAPAPPVERRRRESQPE